MGGASRKQVLLQFLRVHTNFNKNMLSTTKWTQSALWPPQQTIQHPLGTAPPMDSHGETYAAETALTTTHKHIPSKQKSLPTVREISPHQFMTLRRRQSHAHVTLPSSAYSRQVRHTTPLDRLTSTAPDQHPVALRKTTQHRPIFRGHLWTTVTGTVLKVRHTVETSPW